MKTCWWLKKALVVLMMVGAAMMFVGCDDDDDEGDPRDGLLQNQTPYQVRINFTGIKVVEIAPGTVVRESAFEEGKTYYVEVVVLGADGAVLQTLDQSVYIDKDVDDYEIANKTCSWYLRVFGNSVPFSLDSAS